MWPVSTTGPKFILFYFYIFQTLLLAYNLEKCLHLVLAPRSATRQILAQWTSMAGAKSKSMFSLSLQMNTPNNQDNLPQIKHLLSPTKGIPRIFTIFETISIYLRVFLVESKPNPNIWEWTPTLQQFSQIIQGIHSSYRHLLNQQCWEWYWTIIQMLLWQFSTAASTNR